MVWFNGLSDLREDLSFSITVHCPAGNWGNTGQWGPAVTLTLSRTGASGDNTQSIARVIKSAGKTNSPIQRIYSSLSVRMKSKADTVPQTSVNIGMI